MHRFFALFVLLAAACAGPGGRTAPGGFPAPSTAHVEPTPTGDPGGGVVGVLVMAHGGSPEWNASVDAAVASVGADVPTAVAYGMADPYTLESALESLEAQDVERVAVVRMFLSGESFFDQTRFFLGMVDTPPDPFVLMGSAAADPDARVPLEHDLTVATHADGILGAPEAVEVMLDRARALSVHAGEESVLLLAHGMGEEAENRRVLDEMDRIAARVGDLGFADVRTATLREDWPEARAAAEADIRSWFDEQRVEERRVLVLPVRLSGFGPYAEVLAGLPYLAGEGLLPHEAIGHWVAATANRVSCGEGWGPLTGSCPAVTSPVPSPSRR
jgi:hypothetical protein